MGAAGKGAATAALVASLVAGATTLTTGIATAADGPDVQGPACGFDDRNPPPTVRAGSTGNTVKEAQCLPGFWTGLQMMEGKPGGVFGEDATSATEFFQGPARGDVAGPSPCADEPEAPRGRRARAGLGTRA